MTEDNDLPVQASPIPSDLPARTELAVLSIEVDTPADDVRAVVLLVDTLKRLGIELEQRMKERLKPWLEANGGELVMTPDDKFYLGVEREVKNVDLVGTVRAAYQAAMTVDAGTGEERFDPRLFADMMSVNGFKQSICKKMLNPQDFAALFETRETSKVKHEGGRSVRDVQRINLAFVK